MSEVEIVRWEVEPLERSRRGIDERLALLAPGLRRRVTRRAMTEPAGSTLRRKLLTRGVRVAGAANNRRTAITSELGNVNTLEDGLLVRQENFRTWQETLDALRRAAGG